MGSQTDSSDDQLSSPSLQREALTHRAPVISTSGGLEQVRSRCAAQTLSGAHYRHTALA